MSNFYITEKEMNLHKQLDKEIQERQAQTIWGVSTEEAENYFNKLLNKFKQDPRYELRQELGQMLFKHIDNFTEEEIKRYNELKELLKD